MKKHFVLILPNLSSCRQTFERRKTKKKKKKKKSKIKKKGEKGEMLSENNMCMYKRNGRLLFIFFLLLSTT